MSTDSRPTVSTQLHSPALQHLSEMLNRRLHEAGQSLCANDMPSLLVACNDDHDNLLGAVKGEIAFTSLHVSELWVDEGARGRGIATRLMADIEDEARARGCTRIHLETRNPKALMLYEKLGFSIFGTLLNYADGQDFWYLQKGI